MPFVKGDKNINRKGRRPGSIKEKSFLEFFEEIAFDIARANKMPVNEVKKLLYKVGYAKAKEGNYSFYKDYMDRMHGKAKDIIDFRGDFNVTADPEKKAQSDAAIDSYLKNKIFKNGQGTDTTSEEQ